MSRELREANTTHRAHTHTRVVPSINKLYDPALVAAARHGHKHACAERVIGGSSERTLCFLFAQESTIESPGLVFGHLGEIVLFAGPGQAEQDKG